MGTLKKVSSHPRIALSFEQMQNLMALGVVCKDASMVYHPVSRYSNIFTLRIADFKYQEEFWNDKHRIAIVGEDYFNQMYGRDVPAYTAEDIMRKLPDYIIVRNTYHRFYISMAGKGDRLTFFASYSFRDKDGGMVSMLSGAKWSSTSLIDLLYDVMLWCINNKYLPL